ncbi:MAG: RNA polymerase sigma factor [Sphingobacteriales bacterium]|nr:MAG: RNA polymerase sigma factor [Sphingobacteriales bacterium]
MNAKEYNELVNQHSDGLYRFILKNIKDESEAQDVVQDAFEKLWINKDKVDLKKAKSWLFSTAYHTMIDNIRKLKKIDSLEEYHEEKHFYADEYMGTGDMLEKALNKLPAIQKSVVLLRDYEGYAYDEIAEITSLNVGQVKVYIHRARTFLRDLIEKMENYSYGN